MLTLSANAADAIRTIVAESEFDEDAGLRFSAAKVGEEEAYLSVVLAPTPVEGDEQVESGGAHVFLDPLASQMLADQELEAFVGEGGETGFSFFDRTSRNGSRSD